MIHAIVRLFESEARAREGVQRVMNWGFGADLVSVVSPAAGSLEAITQAIAAAHVLKSHARVYAQGVARGGTLVVVRAPFGKGVIVGQLLDSAGTIDAGEVPGEAPGARWDDAAPLSSALRWPTLARGGSNHFSPMLLASGDTTCTALGIPELQESGQPTTAGMGLISHDPTPLSSLLKLPTLI